MAVNTSGWSKSHPSGTSSIRDGDDMLRSDKSILENVLNLEHEFGPQASASSLSGGIHKQGSARVYMVARSSIATPSSADSAGRLAVDPATGAIHILNSSSVSTLVGGSSPYGAVRTGTAQVFASGAISVMSFPTSQYDVGSFSGTTGFTIPSGLGGVYQISASYYNNTSLVTLSTRVLTIQRDGSDIAGATSTGTLVSGTGVVDCLTVSIIDSASSGSRYNAAFAQNTGVNLTAGSARLSVVRVS